MASGPPTIFSPRRVAARRARVDTLQRRTDPARFVLDDMVDDVIERLAFVRHAPSRALVIGDWTGALAAHLEAGTCMATSMDVLPLDGHPALDCERPYPEDGFDLVASLGVLDTVNDLPGALIHIREALVPGGLAIASFVGAGSVPVLRHVMLAADGDRPAGRTHPLVDVRAAAQLLQRAGWADPVVDSHTLDVRYASLGRLLADMRAQGLGNALASPAPSPGKTGLVRAREAFAALAEEDGRVTERFEIITLTGRRPKARF